MLKRLFIIILLKLFLSANCYAAYEEPKDSVTSIELEDLIVYSNDILNKATGYTITNFSSESVKGKTTKDILTSLPSISEENRSIYINGIPISEIRIDGTTVIDQNLINNIPAELIKTVSVTYMPESNHINSHSGGVISIQLKKQNTNGISGNLSGSFIMPFKQTNSNDNISVNINGLYKSLNFFNSFAQNYNDITENYDDITNHNNNEQIVTSLTDRIRNHWLTNNLSLDYTANLHNRIGGCWYIGHSISNRQNFIKDCGNYNMKDFSKKLVNNLSFFYKFKPDNRNKLSINTEWMNRFFSINQIYNFDHSNPNMKFINKTNICKFHIEWQHSFHSCHSLIVGSNYNMTYLNIYNYIYGVNGSFQTIHSHKPSVFISATGFLGKFHYHIGTNCLLQLNRIKNYHSKTEYSLDPSLQFSIPFNENNIQVGYTHILDEVPYDALTNKSIWSNQYKYTVGNSAIKTPDSHLISSTCSFYKRRLNLSVNFLRTDNAIFWKTILDPTNHNTSYIKPINLKPMNAYILYLDYSNTFFNCWFVKGSAKIAFNREFSNSSDTDSKITRMRQYYTLATTINLPNNWSLSANIFWEPTYKYYENSYIGVYKTEFSVFKSFFENKLRVNLKMIPFGKRREVIKVNPEFTTANKITTSIQSIELKIAWFFKSGNIDSSSESHRPSLKYHEITE